MKATNNQEVFGPRSDPRTEVALPALITAGKFFRRLNSFFDTDLGKQTRTSASRGFLQRAQ